MKFIPILFSTDMVQALLENRKTMTRRICKHQHWSHSELVDVNTNKITRKVDTNVSCPYGKVGDVLWVRESFYEPISEGLNGKYYYKATLEPLGWDFKWKPSIHMPKSACRLFLEITNIRVERLQDISEQDAEHEGIISYGHDFADGSRMLYADYLSSKYPSRIDAKDSFRTLWQKVNGIDSWDTNPWVWVVEFKRIDRPHNFI